MKTLNAATNEEIFKALKEVIEIPEHVQSLTLKLDIDNVPTITFTQIAEKPKDN